MKTQFGKIVRESDICVLCGCNPATTKEHIPPRSLFIERPSKYLSVPACENCNNSTKLDDEYLRQVMAGGSLVGQGVDVWKKKVSPKFKDFPKTQSGLRNQLSVGKVKVGPTETLISPLLTLENERVERSIRKMVYGLYWFHSGNMLDQESHIQYDLLNPANGPDYFKNPENIACFHQTMLGVYQDSFVRNTFFYTYAISESTSLWYFFFYKQNIFIAFIQK